MQIALRDAHPGMILAADVEIPGGTLLNKDQVLDETLIALLQNCEITEISITGNLTAQTSAAASTPSSGAGHASRGRITSVEHDSASRQSPDDGRTVRGDVHEVSKDNLPSGRDTLPPVSKGPVESAPECPQQTPPVITVTVSPDAMSACLLVEPAAGSAAGLDHAAIMTALTAQGVVSGIKADLVDKLVEQWKQHRRRYEIDTIAAGTPAKPAEEGPLRMLLSHISTRSECDAIKASRYFWEAAATQPHFDRANKGQVIAEKQISHLSVPGKNVYGAPVFTEDAVPTEVVIEEGAAFGQDTANIIARTDGIAYQIGNAIGVIPIDFNGTFEIEISSDDMFVRLIVHPPGPGGALPGKEEIRRMLSQKGVVSGILEPDLDTILALCERGAYPSEPFTIARGMPPVRGTDGKLQYHFSTQTSLSPAIGTDGHADYKSINIVNSVTGQQELVSLVPPTAGSDGFDVRGRVIPAEPGTAARLPQGPHTVIDPQNPGLLRADIDGIVRLSGGNVEVCEGFVVPGDVDFSTGNINYAKTVVVNGDVKSGFSVHCGGDLQVNGTIEDCHITVGGNVLCKYGFVGQGKGTIEAKGDVNLGFMKNQTVRCFKNITIAKEVINSILLSRNAIVVHGNPLSVVGGALKARASVTVFTAGNITGIRTLLEAGIDYLMADELAMIEEQHKTTSLHYHSLADNFTRYQKTIAGRKRLSSVEQARFNELTGGLRQAKQQLTVLEGRREIVTGKLHPLADAFIRIEHAAYPGTLFKFGERHYLLKEELIGPKNIRYIDSEIRVL